MKLRLKPTSAQVVTCDLPGPKTRRYTVTSQRVAFFYAKLDLWILRSNWAASVPEDDQLPRPFRAVLEQLDREIAKLYEEAALAACKLASILRISLHGDG